MFAERLGAQHRVSCFVLRYAEIHLAANILEADIGVLRILQTRIHRIRLVLRQGMFLLREHNRFMYHDGQGHSGGKPHLAWPLAVTSPNYVTMQLRI